MVVLWAARVAAAAPVPLIARSQSTASPFGLDSVDHSSRPDPDYPAARDSDVHDPAGAPAGGLSLSAPGPGHADRALQPHPDGAGPDDDLVPDDSGAQPGGPAGRRALPSGPDDGLGGHRPRSPAGEAFPAALRAREGPGPVYRGGADSAPREARTTCPCGW